MDRLINYKQNFSSKDAKKKKAQSVTASHLCCLAPLRLCVKLFKLLPVFLCLGFNLKAQQNIREDILLNNDWENMSPIKPLQHELPIANDYYWSKINLPDNRDAYAGYRRLLHGNNHNTVWYRKLLPVIQPNRSRRNFLFFEGVGSYAKVYLNRELIGEHAGGRTSFTLDVTGKLKANGFVNEILVKVDHPANIKDLPWVCGGCSDERGFSEGSQPMGIFRPVHLIVTNDVRVEPFGVHAWADIKNGNATLSINTTIKNYSEQSRHMTIINQLVDAKGRIVKEINIQQLVKIKDSITVLQNNIAVDHPDLWSVDHPYLYKIISLITENNSIVDKTVTDFGFRTINWKTASHQFLLNDKPVFINGIAEYEHLLGQSHAFSNEQIMARMQWIQSAGFNALRDAHQPHHLLYGKLCNEKGILWWTQFSAHVWYDTKVFRENFKTLLREWVIERRNDPAVILWGLQNESKLPKDFAAECTALIRSLDPTASSQRLVTTCNGGEGTDWDVPQNWTGTYGGNPATYAADIKKQVLIGEYGAWRTLDLHTEGGFAQNGILSEDRMTQLMEQKIRLAESVKDSCAGQFFWLLTSHDNPGRVQGGEGVRELDRIGPVNYKGLLTPWEEPTDAYYMFRSNYASKETAPMVYIVSHTWPSRWMKRGIKDSIIVYSNCDEVELFNDIDAASLGKQQRNGIGTHFQWDKANIQYNVLYAVGYVNGKAVARDTIVLNHLPQAPHFNKLYADSKSLTKPQAGYQYVYRINCGGADYKDESGNNWLADKNFSRSWTNDFPGMPEYFASQRRTFSPVKNTKDWKLFQSFRYGKDRLKFEFDVEDGDYLVELYFIEPWLGIGGGVNAKAMRLFDVAINKRTVLNNLDIWEEAGTNAAIKKTVKAKITGGKIIISFPESKVGQAIISAIAIAKEYDPEKRRTVTKRIGTNNINSWLDIGDTVFAGENIQVNALPSNLYGADWLKVDQRQRDNSIKFTVEEDKDVFIAHNNAVPIYEANKIFANTKSAFVTDENGGTVYEVYKARYVKGSEVLLQVNRRDIICIQPVNNMQPAYDQKPTISYRPATAKLNGPGLTTSMTNEKETITFNQNQTAIEWTINIGAADMYSLNIRYANIADKNLTGSLQIIMADGSIITNEKITFTNSKPGKWNFISSNTGSMINAGNYVVKIIADDAVGVGISGLDIQ